MRWPAWRVILLLLGARTAAAQVVDPVIEVRPERDSATVGDSVSLRVRVRLDDRDLLLDSVPRLATDAPRDMRVLAAGRVVRQPDRTFAGRIVVAFYRPGRRVVPPFALTYRRNVSVLGATVRSEPAAVEIVPVLPGGSSQRLQDIKDLEPVSAGDLVLLGVAVVVLAALFGFGFTRWRRGTRRVLAAAPSAGAPSVQNGALELALERLRDIEREQWPARGEVARHYEAVATVVRDYLAEAARIPARTSTTAEILEALPASLTPNGTRERLRGLLREADLVKFARVLPPPPDSALFLDGARGLLTAWATDAVR